MKKQLMVWSILLIAILAAVTASIGAFSVAGSGPFQFTTLRGQAVEIYGRGPLGAKADAPGLFHCDDRRRAVQVGQDAGLDALEIFAFFDQEQLHLLHQWLENSVAQ